jgi:hypothetical protein
MKYSRLLTVVFLTVASLICFSACSSTSVKSSWVAPDVSKIRFKKVVVVMATPDSGGRRIIEDAVKARITGAECISSYTLLSTLDDLRDIDKVSAALKAAAADGVIVLRPISVSTEVNVIPGAVYPLPYQTFRGYYQPAYGLSAMYYQEPDQITTDHIVRMETSIYEVAGGRLIWSAATTTNNPEDIHKFIADLSSAIIKELVQQKLIGRP